MYLPVHMLWQVLLLVLYGLWTEMTLAPRRAGSGTPSSLILSYSLISFQGVVAR